MAENVQNKEKIDKEKPVEKQRENKFRWKFYETSDVGTKLVRVNKWTSNVYGVERNGIHINILPWLKQKIYNLQEQKFDTPHASSLTSDGNGVSVDYDTDYMYVISDPVKLAEQENGEKHNLESTRVKQNICDKLDNIVRDYVVSHSRNDIVGKGSINILSDFAAKEKIKEIKKDYGIEITQILIKNVRLPKNIEEQLQKNEELKLKKKQMEYENEIEIQKAQTAQAVTKINAEGEADRINRIIAASAGVSKDSGIPASIMAEAVGQKLANEALVNGSNPNTTVIATNAVNYSSGQNSNNNGNYDLNAIMSAAIAAVANNQNKNGGNGSVNNNSNAGVYGGNQNYDSKFTPSSITFLSDEELAVLEQGGFIDQNVIGRYFWEGLKPEAITYLKGKGFETPEEKQKQQMHR